MPLTLEQLKAAAGRTIDVDVPALGGTVRIGLLNASDGMRIAQSFPTGDLQNTNAMLTVFVEVLACTICDESGAAICNTDEGRALVRALPIGVIMSLGSAALELNGLCAGESEKKS